jgi:hypothetical protein
MDFHLGISFNIGVCTVFTDVLAQACPMIPRLADPKLVIQSLKKKKTSFPGDF